MTPIQSKLIKAFLKFKKTFRISDDAQILFLYKIPGADYEEKGIISDYFFFKSQEDQNGKNITYLKILNTPENLALLDSSNLIVARNFNPLYNGLTFSINKRFETSSGMTTILREINATGQTYPPPA